MEKRVNSLETELEILKRDMNSCQEGLHKDIKMLRHKRAEMPSWIKNSAFGIILAVFSQTITTVWWASEISARQESLGREVMMNSKFRMDFPKMHEDVMVALKGISIRIEVLARENERIFKEHDKME